MKNLKKLSKNEMKEVNGGMIHNDANCGNVIDLRAGAPPRWKQELSNWWCLNFG